MPALSPLINATERCYARLGMSRQFDFRSLQANQSVIICASTTFAIETDDIDGLRHRLSSERYHNPRVGGSNPSTTNKSLKLLNNRIVLAFVATALTPD